MPRGPLVETFTVERYPRGTALVRSAVPLTGGAPYRHTCPLTALETVAHAIEEAGESGFTMTSLQQTTGLAFTQVATAMAFLRERGIIEMHLKRNYPMTTMAHLDAMIEYHALREGQDQDPPTPSPAPDAPPAA